ncbi:MULTISPECIES: ATP-dependent helicase HrpB [unclassified Pseudoxanthomonas]|uniref:ATP-dependent helicase HrpB n=1 Tax=unclassified Pseudoxanthomonas TaxID=2645906 RepID=UPI0008EAA1C2|nr:MULTISPECIES: ATP-dependent helicase HrpB [unclassified Pseudoxanthomonas]SFV31784.1 ATP-dependent helicase HrpB [Pseudoxanthomonas sp. YR558]
MPSPTFPITPLLPDIVRSLSDHPRLVLEAPPGAGKTTQVPLALLDEPWLQGRKIVMLEPRRVAARAAAGFMAKQRGEAVGDTIGYRIRFENKIGPDTRIEVVTEGILTRMIQDDPMLESVGAILFDEFHERHLAGDLGLALALDVQAQLREDLRIVVMSATLDGEKLARFLDAPRLSSEGRGFPVQVAHFPARRDEPTDVQARRAIEQAVQAHPGDVLVFLPGQREIARVATMLADALPQDIVVLALHGELPVEKQSEALQPDPQGRRRVVLATNVAESSVTLPGVRVVVDSGLAREPSYDPNSGFSRLEVTTISQASADQRAGRAGRVAEGWAYRLWPQSQRLDPQRRPEIALVELGALALELAAWGSDDLRFVDAPPPGAMNAARDLLRRLGALTATNAITPLGKRMLALGTHPRLAAMLLSAGEGEDRALACDLAALVEARDPLRMGGDALAARWRALAAFRSGRAPQEANRSGLAAIEAAAKQWRRRVRENASPPSSVEAHRLGDVLMHAFPDRIGFQHPQDARRYLLANGRSARLFDDSALVGEPWIVVSELRHEARDALVQRAAPLDERRLRRDFADRFVTEDTIRWDASRRALSAQRESRFDQIVFDARPAGRVDPVLAAAALTDAVRDLGLDALPWPESLQQWRERVRCLREWMPDLGLPDLSDDALMATLDTWLKPAFAGKTRLDALGEDDLANALKSGLDWSLRQRIDALAPTRITVPSGMERRIEYAHGQPPVLAVKLQELFGLADTPRVADGRVPVLLHLLSPGGKPLQVTSDLRNFWNSTYAEVKKEMKGRYPKHPWPDDPWSAQATHRAKPRGT